jgi:hypothetical protein
LPPLLLLPLLPLLEPELVLLLAELETPELLGVPDPPDPLALPIGPPLLWPFWLCPTPPSEEEF